MAIVGDEELISRQMNFDQILKHVEVGLNVMRSRQGWIFLHCELEIGEFVGNFEKIFW